MSWYVENSDPIGDLTRMKKAIKTAPPYRVYVNPIDLLNFESAGIFSGETFVIADDDVPVGYVMVNDRLLDVECIMSAFRHYETPSICYSLSEPRELLPPKPRNRAERRTAMKKMKNRRR